MFECNRYALRPSKLAIEVEFVMGDNNNASFVIAVTGAIEKQLMRAAIVIIRQLHKCLIVE